MSELYEERCKECGKFIEIHLNDLTLRYEIFVICGKCLENEFSDYKPEKISLPSILWNTMIENILMVYLTENAWLNRYANYPNLGDKKVLEEFEGNFIFGGV